MRFRRSSSPISSINEYKLLKTFEFTKAASDTVISMMNGAYDDKPLIFIGATYRDKPLIFIGATFQEKLVSHHQSVNINC